MVQGEYLKVNNFTMALSLPAAFSSQSLSAKESVFIFSEKESVRKLRAKGSRRESGR